MNAKKIKEWYNWGKEAYKNTDRMMRNNSGHPDYDTPEKREAIHNKYGNTYMLDEKHAIRLKNTFNYDDEDIAEAHKEFKKGYEASRKWYKKADEKYQAIIDEFMPIFKKAEMMARAIDVSDIKDSFPCGSAHLYLDRYPEHEKLREALGHFATSETEAYKYRIPIKMPSYGQCVAFSERICEEVRGFLRTKGIFTNIHSWID